MTLGEFQERCYLYALGLLEEDEKQEFLQDLTQGGEPYQRALKQALAVNASVLSTVDPVEPPKRLRSRVLSALTGKQDRSFQWSWILAPTAAALLGVAIWQGTIARRSAAELAQVQNFLSDPQTKSAGAGQGTASYYLNPTRGVVLVARNLEGLDTARTYQMWIIPRGQNPRPAGLFRPDSSGTAIHVYAGAVDVQNVGAMAVSVEPAAGSPQPTTTPFLVAPVGGP